MSSSDVRCLLIQIKALATVLCTFIRKRSDLHRLSGLLIYAFMPQLFPHSRHRWSLFPFHSSSVSQKNQKQQLWLQWDYSRSKTRYDYKHIQGRVGLDYRDYKFQICEAESEYNEIKIIMYLLSMHCVLLRSQLEVNNRNMEFLY